MSSCGGGAGETLEGVSCGEDVGGSGAPPACVPRVVAGCQFASHGCPLRRTGGHGAGVEEVAQTAKGLDIRGPAVGDESGRFQTIEDECDAVPLDVQCATAHEAGDTGGGRVGRYLGRRPVCHLIGVLPIPGVGSRLATTRPRSEQSNRDPAVVEIEMIAMSR